MSEEKHDTNTVESSTGADLRMQLTLKDMKAPYKNDPKVVYPLARSKA